MLPKALKTETPCIRCKKLISDDNDICPYCDCNNYIGSLIGIIIGAGILIGVGIISGASLAAIIGIALLLLTLTGIIIRRMKPDTENEENTSNDEKILVSPKYYKDKALSAMRPEKEKLSERKIAYKKYLKSKEWYEVRGKHIEMDIHECQLCGRSNSLQVHHKKYPANWFETSVEDLIHFVINAIKDIIEYFKNIYFAMHQSSTW